METPNPATPAKAATPGNSETVVTPPVVTPAAVTPADGINPAGTVTLSAKEFADLSRDAARGKSPKNQPRIYSRPASVAMNVDPNDPVAVALATAQQGREAAERKALQMEVQGKVRDLLADDRFKDLPKSTKDLILARPHMLSDAETLEDAMYDIEDKLLEMAGTPAPVPGAPVVPAVAARETPPVATPGAPAAVDSKVVEPTENLRGPARSQAMIRNAMRQVRP